MFKNHIQNRLLVPVIIFFINLLLISLIVGGFFYYYKDKLLPGITISDYRLQGKNEKEVREIVGKIINKLSAEGFVFAYKDKKHNITPTIGSPETANEIIAFNIDKTIKDSFAIGHNKNILLNIKDAYLSLVYGIKIPIAVEINEELLKKTLRDNFNSLESPAQNAELIYNEGFFKNASEDLDFFSIKKETSGQAINYDNGLTLLKINLAKGENTLIELSSAPSYPDIKEQDCVEAKKEAARIVNLAPLTIQYPDCKASASATSTFCDQKLSNKKWEIPKKLFASWLKIIQNNKDSHQTTISLDKDKVTNFIKDKITKETDDEVKEAKFQITNGKISAFQNGGDGHQLNKERFINDLENIIKNKETKNIILEITIIKNTSSDDITNNKYGIKEIIGTGQSNFSGSPKNRRHNIRTGASAVNGTLIKPNEEFSLLKTLGKIDGSSGYLQELVIKEGKTIPEYGGGLCQIGTTAFRGATNSGFPITLRRNHSYRVSYYEPAGTDATIYDPWPDFRFLNDTGNYILIQTRIEGNNLYFDFWGTKDGRKIEKTKPTIYNIVKPAPTKIIETLDLKPGEKKCTEHAHNGADAYFDYKVTYQSGEIKEKRFSSHYVPWQEVCLLGVAKLSEQKDTTEIITATTSKNILTEKNISDQSMISTTTKNDQ